MSALRLIRTPPNLTTIATLAALGIGPAQLAACHGTVPTDRVSGQTEFTSAPQLGQGSAASGASFGAGGASGGVDTTTASNGAAAPASSGGSTRTVQETDLYAVEGNRLYYLNSYRGLMVFDITNPDAPQFLGRSAIFGDPQEMTVDNGICVVVVGDWYGIDNGEPFHGSIVRGLNAQDPTNITVVGEAHLGGYVQDTRVVGNVLYAVIQDYGWQYGWYNGWAGGPYGGGYGANASPTVAVASVSFANGVVTPVGYQKFTGTGGVFSVTPNAIMLATNVSGQPTTGNGYNPAGETNLQYVDISDPGGAIKLRGSIDVSGAVTGWGPDNGRWNLDFADGATAHALGCSQEYCGGESDAYLLSTVDFSNPDAPVLSSSFSIANLGWSAAARFSGSRLYLSPSGYYGNAATTPFSIYDLSNPLQPALAGTTQLSGTPWIYLPDGNNLFSVGSSSATNSTQVQVEYLGVSNPSAPTVLGTTSFGSGWAWSPAATTFKAVTVDDALGFVVVPFSGWDYNGAQYTNGVQLVQFTPSGITSSATAFSKGWVQRGIFVNGRLFSISDEALAVVDYSNPTAPQVKTQLTLARNVVNAQPQGSTIAELSSDWFGNDVSSSEMRVLPIANAAETTDDGQGVSANIAGVGAQAFQNGTLTYVVTSVQHSAPCNQWSSPMPSGTGCVAWGQQVQVVDTSNGSATLRGQIMLPDNPMGWSGWGWGGFWYYDWFGGADVVQVGGNALAFRRWLPQYAPSGPDGGYTYVDALDALYVVDLSNPDAPSLASMTVTTDPTAWWGAMQAVGDTLYTTHYEWVSHPDPKDPSGTLYYVKYYLDVVDLTDRAHPSVGQKINVPGQLVGASSKDPTILYTIDYRWDDTGHPRNDLDVVKLDGGLAHLQSVTQIDGWVGQVFVQNDVAYTTVQEYDWMLPTAGNTYTPPYVELHQIDLSNPKAPVDYTATSQAEGWGWLLGVQGDRAIVTSGWGPMGYDIYKLSPKAAPVFDQSVHALGWGPNSILRQDNTLYVSSGYWGVQPIVLQ